MKLKDKVAIVTGGARGIGEAIVRAYAAEGAHVVIADIEIAKAQELASELGAKGLAVRLDVRDSKSISALIATTVSKFGGVDILVNNAAIFDMAPILEVSEASFDNQFAVNVKGLFFTLQAVASQMAAQGRGGKIINVASQAGRRGEALVAVYCATKAAVISLTQSAGLGLIKNGINVNGIAPGVVDTPGSTRCSPNTKIYRLARKSAKSVPRCRPGEWAPQMTIVEWPFFWLPTTQTTLLRRRSTSMAEIG
jgi:NAD(P)-dependent dehydrogenase (short-subunit alcohol dehydrogenase family)